MTRSLRLAAAAVVFGTLALGATAASAHGPHFGGHGGGLHFGKHFVGKHFGGGWGGWHRGYARWGGWGYRIRPVVYGGCYLKSFVDIYGNPYIGKVCY